MDGTSLVRFRWRLRGAWMWPAFIALTALDGLLIHWRPLAGDHESAIAGWLLGVFASLFGIVVLAPVLAFGVRRFRTDMPHVVARDYAGAATTVMITAAIAAIGLAHHATTVADEAALQDATARAEAYIGTYAPPQFQRHMTDINTYELQPPLIYRSCVTVSAAPTGTRSYCVVVHRDRPFGQSVTFAGSEPNSLLEQGTS
jgi:hypothetical protein